MYALVSTDDLGRKVLFPLTKVRTVIGRDPDCDIILSDADVSREHAKIYLMEGRVEIKDMGSRNGTFVNNQLIEGMTLLQLGDEIIVGSNQFFLREEAGEVVVEDMTAYKAEDVLRDETRPFEAHLDEAEEEGVGFPEDAGDFTVLSTQKEMMAGIYDKKIALACFPSVEVLFGKQRGSKFLLPAGDYLIGRGAECNIRLDDEKVSTRHGIIRVGHEKAIYEDLGSTNGTLINNRLEKQVVLQHDDVLVLGDSKLKFMDSRKVAKPRKDEEKDASYGLWVASQGPLKMETVKKRSGLFTYLAIGLVIAIAVLFLLTRS